MKQTSLSMWVFTLMRLLLRPANRVMVLLTAKTQRQNWQTVSTTKGLCAKKTPHNHGFLLVAFSCWLLSDLSHLNLNLGHEVLGSTSLGCIFFAGGIAEWSGSSLQADMLDSLEMYVKSLSWQEGEAIRRRAELLNTPPCCFTSQRKWWKSSNPIAAFFWWGQTTYVCMG